MRHPHLPWKHLTALAALLLTGLLALAMNSPAINALPLPTAMGVPSGFERWQAPAAGSSDRLNTSATFEGIKIIDVFTLTVVEPALTDGAIIDKREFPSFTLMLPSPAGSGVESVLFTVKRSDSALTIDPTQPCAIAAECRHIENVNPYTLAGNLELDVVLPWPAEVGNYILTAQGYTEDNGMGVLIGELYTLRFSVVDSSIATATPTIRMRPTSLFSSTPVPVPLPDGELLINPSFEIPDEDDDKRPAVWSVNNALDITRQCDPAEDLSKRARNGGCSLRLLPTGDMGQFNQTVDGDDIYKGDQLELSIWVRADDLDASGFVRARFFYKDGTEPTTIRLDIPQGTYRWIQLKELFFIEDTDVETIDVRVRLRSGTGRVRVDDVSLVRVSTKEIVLP